MLKVRPRIGLLNTGHKMYWGQFPELKQMGASMTEKLLMQLNIIGEVKTVGLVDTYERATEASDFYKTNEIDILIIFPLGYTTGMMIAPVIQDTHVPIIILNAHEDPSYDYKRADTAQYLHHEGPCCIPEYAVTLTVLNKNFKVLSGHFADKELWKQVARAASGAAAGTAFKKMRFGVIGNTYTNMTDMPTDEHRILAATGSLLVRPEIEAIQNAYLCVNDNEIEEMFKQFREMYDVDGTVTNDHLRESAKIAIAFEQVIKQHNINAFGYYWWGVTENVTQLRSESALAVSRLAAMGIPGVTEGDVKTAMAMKILDLLGGGGMFLEFFAIDYSENFILVGHDGPSNINIAAERPRLQFLNVHHGKTGDGLGIDFNIKKGECTLLNVSQFKTGKHFKLVYSIGETIDGDILNIGNPNCRVRVKKPIPIFMNDWCQQAPSHHFALGIGDFSQQIEYFAEAMDFECIRI
jgi:L-arabinose isomerase